jgi:hypothetical protein
MLKLSSSKKEASTDVIILRDFDHKPRGMESWIPNSRRSKLATEPRQICQIYNTQLTLELQHSIPELHTQARIGRRTSKTYISLGPRHLNYMRRLLRQPKQDGKTNL